MRVPHVSLTSPVPLADRSVPLISTSPFSFPATSALCSASPNPRCPVDLRDPRRPTGQPCPGLPEASLSLGSRRAVGMIRFHRAAPVILAGLPFGARTPKTPAASFNWHRRTPCASTTPHRNHRALEHRLPLRSATPLSRRALRRRGYAAPPPPSPTRAAQQLRRAPKHLPKHAAPTPVLTRARISPEHRHRYVCPPPRFLASGVP